MKQSEFEQLLTKAKASSWEEISVMMTNLVLSEAQHSTLRSLMINKYHNVEYRNNNL